MKLPQKYGEYGYGISNAHTKHMNSRRHEWINGGEVREQVRNQRNLQKIKEK